MINSSEQKKEDNMRYYAGMHRDYLDYKRAKLAEPIETRAKDMRIASFVWLGATGETEIPEAMKEKIAERQLAYLKDHPGTMYANPVCYKNLMPHGERKIDGVAGSTALRRSCLTFAQNLVSSDKFTRV